MTSHGMRAHDSAFGGAVVRRGQSRPRRPIRAGILAASGDKSSRANRRKDRKEEDKKPLTKLAPEFPLDLRAKTCTPELKPRDSCEKPCRFLAERNSAPIACSSLTAHYSQLGAL